MCNVVPGERGGLSLDKEEKAMGTLRAAEGEYEQDASRPGQPTATAPSHAAERRARKHPLLVPARQPRRRPLLKFLLTYLR